MNSTTTVRVVLLAVVLSINAVVGAQDIVGFQNGRLTFETADTNLYYTVEWASNIGDGIQWSNEIRHLVDIRPTGTTTSVSVPMNYRVVAREHALPFGVMGAVICETNATYALAAVTAGDDLFTNVNVWVNDAALHLIELEGELGAGAFGWTNTLPIFSATLTNIGPSSIVTLRVEQVAGPFVYESAALAVPPRPVLTAPGGLTPVPDDVDLAITWNFGGLATGFLVGYESLEEQSADIVAESLSSDARGVVIAASRLVLGTGTVSVASYEADPPTYPLNEDDEAAAYSFFTVTPDEREIVVTGSGSGGGRRSLRLGREPLQIVKEYEKRVEHITFLVRECNPYQIVAPGVIEIDVTYRAKERAVGNYAFYDANGVKYHDFTYTHIYRPNKRHHVYRWPVQPGTTVVISLAKTYLNGAVYETP